MKKSIFLLGAFLMSVAIYAGGYRVSLQGVRQAAMAHTSAHTRDASVLFFNPAGMSFIPEKLSVSLGVFGIKSKSKYQNLDTRYSAETDNDLGTPGYLGIAYRPLKNFSVGVSVTTPYGNAVKWPDGWAGSDMVQDIDLKAFYIQPTISYKFADWFSVGFGYIFAKGKVTLNRSLTSVGADLELDGEASGTGFNLGAYFKPTDKLDISIAYRSNVDMEVNNKSATFTGLPSSLVGTGRTFPTTDDTFSATLPLVSETFIGVSYKFTPKLLIAADVNFAGWQEYKSLDIQFGQARVGTTANPTLSSTPKNFKATTIFRIGGEYALKDNLWLRLGYYHDPTPVSDDYWSPETPSTTNNAVTGGIGYKWNKLNIDAMFAYVNGVARDINNSFSGLYGEATASAIFFGIGFSYNAF